MKLLPLTISIFIFPFFFAGNNISQKAIALPQNVFVNAYKMIDEGQGLLKEGDLIVRLNQDPLSQFIKNFNRHDKRYSHAGIVLFENGHPYVYHMVTGDENPGGKLKKDSFSHFCNPEKNFAYGIYRYNINSIEVKQLKQKLHEWQKKELRFDSSFDSQTDATMYCSEMVKKAITSATKGRIKIESTGITQRESIILASYLHLTVSNLKNFQLVAIENLYLNLNCQPIRQYSFFN